MKRYVQEEGSSQARSLLRKHRILTSAIAPTEAISALSRRRMLQELTAKHFAEILTRIKADCAYWEFVEVSALILNKADEVIIKMDIRALDAIHLAPILTFQTASGIHIPFITGDMRQREAASHLRLDTILVDS